MRRLLPLIFLALSSVLALAGYGDAGANVSQAEPAYLTLGDSLAVGVGASNPQSTGYVPLVHEALLASDPYQERGLVLVNLGVSGATSADLLETGGQLEQALAEIQGRQQDADPGNEVEIITVDIGGNDFLPLALDPESPCLEDPFAGACLAQFAQLLADYEQNLRQLLSALREAAPEANMAVLGLYNSLVGTPLEETVDLLGQQVNSVTTQVAGEEGVGAKMADPFEQFRQRPASEVIAPDMIHPTDAGHALLATAVLAALGVSPPPAPAQMPPTGSAPPAGGSGFPLLLVIALPMSLLGLALCGGGYFLARGRS